MYNSKATLLAVIISSITAQQAAAQTKAADLIPEGGFTESIAKATATERNADTSSHLIYSGDSAGLPDQSMSDALARLPGITITRSGGQAASLQVRGMNDSFVLATINGREQVSSLGTRALAINMLPTEFFQSATLNTSSKASTIEGGIAGTLDFATANPLASKQEQQFHLGIYGNYNSQAKDLYDIDEIGERINFTYSQKLLDDTLGFSLGYAQLKSPSAATQFESYNYDHTNMVPSSSGEILYVSNGFELMQQGGSETLDTYSGAVQFQPTDNLTLVADILHSTLDSNTMQRGFRVAPLINASIANPTTVGDYITGGIFSPRRGDTESFNIQIANDDTSSLYKTSAQGLNIKWVQEALTLSSDISHSQASGFKQNGFSSAYRYRPSPVSQANPTGFEPGYDQLSYALYGTSLPGIQLNADYTDPSVIRLAYYEEIPEFNEDKIDAIRIDGKYTLELPIIESFETGVRTSKRNHQQHREVFVYGDGGSGTLLNDYPLAISAGKTAAVNWQGDLANYPAFLAIDSKAVLAQASKDGLIKTSPFNSDGSVNNNAYDANGNLLPRTTQAGRRWDQGKSWSMIERADIDEEVTSVYAQANIATALAGKSLTGNIGVRYIRTEQSNLELVNVYGQKGAVTICDDFNQCLSQLAYKRVGTTYNNILPSLNLNYELSNNDQLRLALTRNLSRAPFARMANFSVGAVDTSNPERPTFNYGSYNSATLKPFIADQIELNYEHYLDDGVGSYSIAVYHRNIKSFIENAESENFDFAAHGIPVLETAATAIGGVIVDIPVRNGSYYYASNTGKGGYIRGMELSYNQTFSSLPAALSGLGVAASLSLVSSDIEFANTLDIDPNGTLPLAGLVEKSGNFTVFYRFHGFATRLTARYKGSSVGDDGSINPSPIIYAPETLINYQADYKFANGINLEFFIDNLTEESSKSYLPNEDIPRQLKGYGRSYSLGASYSF